MRPKGDQICTRQQKKGENKSSDTLVRSVFYQREEWVASDPRQDTAEENQVCSRRQQHRGESKRPDTSMRSVWCWRKAGASSARSDKGCGQENRICGQPKGGINERPDTMVRSVVWQREKWVASDPRKDAAKGNQICTGQQKGAENERPAKSKPSLF
jgi:hypothetical protein